MLAVAGTIFIGLSGLSNRADAMTFSTPAGLMNAAASTDAAQPEQVYWRRGWGWRRWGWWPRPYFFGYYRPHYYSYYPYGYAYPYWGWRRWW
jgi:hypothetical protein